VLFLVRPLRCALLSRVELESAPGCIKRVAEGNVHVRVRLLFRSFATDVYPAAGHDEIQLDVERCALVAVGRRRLDHYMASGDPIVEPLEAIDVLADSGRDGRRVVQVSESQLQRCLHDWTIGFDRPSPNPEKANVAPWLS